MTDAPRSGSLIRRLSLISYGMYAGWLLATPRDDTVPTQKSSSLAWTVPHVSSTPFELSG